MCHHRRVVHQAFHPAQRLGQGEQFGLLAEALGRFETALQHDRDDAAVTVHLLARQRMLRVRGQARVDHLLHCRVLFQPLCQRHRVGAVRLHAQRQGLQATQRQEAVERALHATHRVLQEGHLLGQFGVVTDHDHATDHVRVAIEVLGGRVQHQVRAQLQRTLQHRRGEGVVDHHDQAMALGDGGDRGDVDDLQHRVGGGLDPHHLRLRRDRRLERRQISQVDKAEVQPGGAATHTLEQAEAPAIDVVHRHHVAAGIQQFDHRRAGGHARRKGEAAGAAFQRSHATLVGEAGRIVRARVLEALVLARAGLRIGRGGVDRRHHRAGARVGRLAAMDGQGGQRQRAVRGRSVGHVVS
ncbi:hypothetical protein D3C71_824310 [compost metagenome]